MLKLTTAAFFILVGFIKTSSANFGGNPRTSFDDFSNMRLLQHFRNICQFYPEEAYSVARQYGGRLLSANTRDCKVVFGGEEFTVEYLVQKMRRRAPVPSIEKWKELQQGLESGIKRVEKAERKDRLRRLFSFICRCRRRFKERCFVPMSGSTIPGNGI